MMYLSISRLTTKLALLMTMLASATAVTTVADAQTNGTAFTGGSSYYTRVVRLPNGNLLASMNGTDPSSNTGYSSQFYQSVDGGQSFTWLSSFKDPESQHNNCCASLFVMPNDLGNIRAGTIFFGSVMEPDANTTKIKIYYSTDNGNSWNLDDTLVTGGGEGSGVWEPEFSIAGDGALVVYWSDETDNANHSQKLREARSYGYGWQDYQDFVASNIQADRPGMAIVSKTPSGYFLTFEHCGPADCEVHYKTSSDGWNWGNVADVGGRIQTSDGRFLKHAPYNIWSFNPQYPGYGALIVVGQIFVDSSGNITSGNGNTLLANTNPDGSGSWFTTVAPVDVYGAANNVCPNYSSPLLQSADGYSILGLATAYDSFGNCHAYYRVGSLYP